MYFPNTRCSLSIFFLVVFLIGCGGLIAFSAPPALTSPSAIAGGPLRLRLKVEQTTVRSKQATKIWAEFLDGEYRQVPNDGTRVVKFEIASPRASAGSISPPEVTVKPGEWSAYVSFAPARPGRVLIRVSSVGLASDETFLSVTPPPASFLTEMLGMFETVAYAAKPLQVLGASDNGTVRTSAGSQAKFQVDFGSAKAGTKIKIFTRPLATIIDEEDQNDDGKKKYDGEMNITLGQDGGMSRPIFVTSPDIGKIKVMAEGPTGPPASAIAEFTAPKPRFIRFVGGAKNIGSDTTTFWVTVQLADDGDNLITSDRARKITFRTGNLDEFVSFENAFLNFQPGQGPTSALVRLKQRLPGKELKILACDADDQSLEPGDTSVFIHSPIETLRIEAQSPVKRGSTNEVTIQLLNEDRKPSIADKDRSITLSVTDGRLSQPQVTILKNQNSAKVQYFPSLATGKVVLRAESVGLTEATKEIELLTPLWWLVLAALGGGLIGGFARYMPKGDRLGEHLAIFKRGSQSWAVNLFGSLIAGFIFYLAIKFGFSPALGFVLSASMDVGTGLAAFFLACIGGYMGIGRVFDGIAGLWERLSAKKDGAAPPAVQGVNNPAHP